MKNGTVITDNIHYISNEIYDQIKAYTISKDNLYITVAGTIGSVGEIPEELDNANLTENADKIVFFQIYKRYLLLALASDTIQSQIRSCTTKVGQPKLAIIRIQNFLLPIPPRNEQEAISSMVDKLLPIINKYDITQNTLDKLNSSIKELLKKSILQEAIQGKLVAQDPNDEPASVLLERIRAEKERLIKEKKIKRDKNESVIYKGDDNSYYEKLSDGSVICIDDEIPFEIPASWSWCRMGNIGDWGAGATPSKGNSSYYGGEILWLRTGELNNATVYDTEIKITEKALAECSLRMNQIGDVLIAMYGATIGKVAIAGTSMATNQACCGCTPIMIFNKYLFYFLMGSQIDFIKKGEGGAQPNISREKLISHLMPIPPFPEQQRIVHKIEELFQLIK